jgi:hypothetical protein
MSISIKLYLDFKIIIKKVFNLNRNTSPKCERKDSYWYNVGTSFIYVIRSSKTEIYLK